MTRFDQHLLGCANHGFAAFMSGLPCTAPYRFTPHAKGLYRQRCEHWVSGWKEAKSKNLKPPIASPNTEASQMAATSKHEHHKNG